VHNLPSLNGGHYITTVNRTGPASGVTQIISVADPGFLSRILIFTHPGSRIPDQQKRGVKKISCHFLF
jgi:hypothetical protein